MKTKYSSNRELCHVWASQSQEYGSSSNLSFESKKLLSYNWHTIGMFINESTVLIRSYCYSSSTAKHMSHMHRAIGSHINTIAVKFLPDQRYSNYNNSIDHEANKNWFVESINECNEKFDRARTAKESYYYQQIRLIENMTRYCDLFTLPIPEYIQINENHAHEEIAIQTAKRAAKELKQKLFFDNLKEEAKPLIEKLTNDWLTLQTDSTGKSYNGYYFSIEETLLRLKGETIETSKGAKVPVKEGKILYNLIQSGKDIKGFRIGNYTVIGINGTLKIGCHEIQRTEIQRFANLMNW